MTAPTILAAADASGLAETVERARALLDEGDVIAARMLAAGVYDQARAAAAYAARFEAGERLLGKARRLQGDALLIEARAQIVIAREWDAAQAAGKASKGGRPKKGGGETVVADNGFTAEEAGLTREQIHAARKLARAEAKTPGIVERAIAARLAAGLEPSRANLRAAVGTASASAAERGNNLYETPAEAMRALLALEAFGPKVWEPACGRGAIVRPLEDAGYDVLLSDLVDYSTADRHGECQRVVDFLETEAGFWAGEGAPFETPPPPGRAACLARPSDPRKGEGDSEALAPPSPLWGGVRGGGTCSSPDIVTNPPYGADLNRFVAHALRVHRPRKMALLLNLNFLCGFEDADRRFAMDDNPPSRVHVFTRRLPMMHRDGWDGPEAHSRMNTAWFVWEQNAAGAYAGPTMLNRVDWKDFVGVAALGPFPPPFTGEGDREVVEGASPPSALRGPSDPPASQGEKSGPAGSFLTWVEPEYEGGRILARLGAIDAGAVFPDDDGKADWCLWLGHGLGAAQKRARSVEAARKALAKEFTAKTGLPA